jgi:hypothetical protein
MLLTIHETLSIEERISKVAYRRPVTQAAEADVPLPD